MKRTTIDVLWAAIRRMPKTLRELHWLTRLWIVGCSVAIVGLAVAQHHPVWPAAAFAVALPLLTWYLCSMYGLEVDSDTELQATRNKLLESYRDVAKSHRRTMVELLRLNRELTESLRIYSPPLDAFLRENDERWAEMSLELAEWEKEDAL